MHSQTRQLFLGAAVAIFLTCAFSALAQDQKANADAATPAAADAGTPTPPAANPPADQKDDPTLRRIDEPASNKKGARKAKTGKRVTGVSISHSGNERVAFGHDAFLGKDEEADQVVAIFGSATSEGRVSDGVVSIFGDTRVTGETGDAVVAILGNVYVNSKVGEVVAVLGNVELGPEAEVRGEVVAVGGTVKRDPASLVHGDIQNVALGGFSGGNFDGLHAWFTHAVLMGRPLAIGPHLGWAWAIALSFLALYVIIALLFAPAVQQCTVTLETRPGYSLLATILTVLLVPVVIVVLCISVVGIALVPLLAIGLFVAGIFGKATMLNWLGTRFTRLVGSPIIGHAAIAVLVGGIFVLLLYLVPFLGFLVFKLLGWLGLGVVVYTLILRLKRDPKPAVAMAAAMPVGTYGQAGSFPGDPGVIQPPIIGAPTAPAIAAATLPRAGFWIRVLALLIDVVVVAMVVGFTQKLLPRALRHDFGPGLLPLLAAYGAVLWKLRGTTIGGIVCGLRVVRLDDRPLDWATTIVRALGCFLSLVVAGFGFIWVAFDDEKQSWHDKIAGTTVVRAPKGVPLV